MVFSSKQRTLAKNVKCSGVGLHSGLEVNLVIKPERINHGIVFVRTDLPGNPSVKAHFNNVKDTSLATVIGAEGIIVSTIEHLMAALAGLAIDNVLIELDAYEVPIMDGSAAPFTAMMQEAGIEEQDSEKCFFVVTEPIEIKDNDRFVGVYPDDTFKITCTIDFDNPVINKQTYSLNVYDDSFTKEISQARTFGFLNELDYLKMFGLAKGGSLDNAIVIDGDGILNEGGLRFSDEFVRHKILDCIGDFSLLGMPILGHVVVEKSGHAFNHEFLKKFFVEKSSWNTASMN